MKYREGDKVQIIDETSEFYNQKGVVMTLWNENEIPVMFTVKGMKNYGLMLKPEQVKLVKSAIRGQEISPSSCCVSNMGHIAASALLEDCPVKDPSRQRQGEDKTVCRCVDNSLLFFTQCEHYKGLKEVIRGGRKVWRVFCDAVETK